MTTSYLDALVELTGQFTVEEWRADEEQGKYAAQERDDEYDPFGRRDFVMLMISIAILAFGIWWVTPW